MCVGIDDLPPLIRHAGGVIGLGIDKDDNVWVYLGAYGHKLADISLNPADHEWVASTPPNEFQSHLTVNVSRDGFVYAADRMADRIHLTTREGKLVKELVFSPPGRKRGENGSRGVAGGVTFSADKEQKYLYVSDMKNNTIWFINRADGRPLREHGRQRRAVLRPRAGGDRLA